MDAKEAKKLTKISKKVNSVLDTIKATAKNGDNTIRSYIDDEVRKELTKLGYHCSPEIDCDSDYRGDWISW